jgi:cytochrome P450
VLGPIRCVPPSLFNSFFGSRFTAYVFFVGFGWLVVQTAAAISTVVMAAAVFPDAQRRVQEELDLVLGPGKAPTFEDMKILPQTHAFVLEMYRWRPVSVGGSYTYLSLPPIASLETCKTGFYVHQASRIVRRKI